MAGKIKNYIIVNAPAGSGKTTAIKTKINEIASKNQNDNILCITYTNRAADELSKDFDSNNIHISTIHSFLHSFMKQYFSHESIIDLYFEVYGEEIRNRIDNPEQKESILVSNEKYIAKYEELSINSLRKNITSLYYNEASFNSLYYGGISHDDLISFSSKIFLQYPIIRTRIAAKFQYVFIDEYQDTTADVMKLFYQSLKDEKTTLYLFGDKMQQIYNNYDGSFEEEFTNFDSRYSLRTNYRSIPSIINILNNIYNDRNFEQKPSDEMRKVESDFLPRVIICSDIEKKIVQLSNINPNSLTLYLSNRARFQAIGSPDLYNCYNRMSRYSYGKNYSPIDILTNITNGNPDSLMNLLFIIFSISKDYEKNQYGQIIQRIKQEQSLFNMSNWGLTNHEDKIILNRLLSNLSRIVNSSKKLIKDVLDYLKKFIPESIPLVNGILDEEDYIDVVNVPISEVRNLFNYLANPKISTQHGVKGESHDEVIFIADKSNSTPVVHMYKFFELWSQYDFSLNAIEDFYYLYSSDIEKLTKQIGLKISSLNKSNFMGLKPTLEKAAREIVEKHETQDLFKLLCLSNYETFINNQNIKNAKACFRETTVYGILSAYKLFYVGCSRARKNLTILLDRTKITGNIDEQVRKFELIGFQVIEG